MFPPLYLILWIASSSASLLPWELSWNSVRASSLNWAMATWRETETDREMGEISSHVKSNYTKLNSHLFEPFCFFKLALKGQFKFSHHVLTLMWQGHCSVVLYLNAQVCFIFFQNKKTRSQITPSSSCSIIYVLWSQITVLWIQQSITFPHYHLQFQYLFLTATTVSNRCYLCSLKEIL